MILFNAFTDCSVSYKDALARYTVLSIPGPEQSPARNPTDSSKNESKQAETRSANAKAEVETHDAPAKAGPEVPRVSPNLVNAEARIQHPGPTV